jgi:hypothetical protein
MVAFIQPVFQENIPKNKKELTIKFISALHFCVQRIDLFSPGTFDIRDVNNGYPLFIYKKSSHEEVQLLESSYQVDFINVLLKMAPKLVDAKTTNHHLGFFNKNQVLHQLRGRNELRVAEGVVRGLGKN